MGGLVIALVALLAVMAISLEIFLTAYPGAAQFFVRTAYAAFFLGISVAFVDFSRCDSLSELNATSAETAKVLGKFGGVSLPLCNTAAAVGAAQSSGRPTQRRISILPDVSTAPLSAAARPNRTARRADRLRL